MRRLIVRASLVGAMLVAGVVADAAAPAGRYTIAGGTVHDLKTGLTWQQTPSSTQETYFAAQTYCASAAVSSALGGTGWRLPTKKELLTFVDYSVAQPGPTIDPAAFPSTPAGSFWAATSSSYAYEYQWRVAFDSGGTGTAQTGDTAYARCVR